MIKVFNTCDQQEFAQLSGDFNPLHMDSLFARRMITGRPVVHGIHLVAWALEQALKEKTRLKSLKVSFLRPVTLGVETICCVTTCKNGSTRVKIQSDGITKSIVDFTVNTQGGEEIVVVNKTPAKTDCKTWDISKIQKASGCIDLSLSGDTLRRLFPDLSRLLPSDQISFLMGATRLIGMECPGLYSLLFKLNLSFLEDGACLKQGLHWRVVEFDSRISLLKMEIEGPHVSGAISAFLRPPPQDQPSFSIIKSTVDPSAFSGQRALVIGGSRGLGEVTAKLLAAGGAKVALTYHQGKKDAESVVCDITRNGGDADCFPFNVLNAAQDIESFAAHNWQPTHLYYLATPPIFVAQKGRFSQDLFQTFCTFYVSGFHNTVKAVRTITKGSLKVLYASSSVLEAAPENMGEYSAAKAAGESLCKFLTSLDRDLSIRIERFPRMLTDQTASLIQTEVADSVDVLSQVLNEMA